MIEPLKKNGFIFDTSKYILSVQIPIMILSAEDDNVVPYTFGKQVKKFVLRFCNFFDLFFSCLKLQKIEQLKIRLFIISLIMF